MDAEGQVRVYSSKLLEELIADDKEDEQDLAPVRKKKKGSQLSRAAKRMLEKREQMRQQDERQQLEIHKRFEETRQKIEQEEERRFQRQMETVENTMDFLDTRVRPMLALTQETKLRKKKELFDEWSHEVYEPIYGQIANHLGSLTSEEIGARKRALFNEFIKTSNQKRVFRDIVKEEDYDPLKAHRHAGKYKTRHLKDPLKKNHAAAAAEAAIQQKDEAKDKTRLMMAIPSWSRSAERQISFLFEGGSS
uniref:Uncharacterized protein n=1 Tax=Lotharella globosa TaxID=91324 RepID=A0A7S3Y823_9EUKA